VHRAVRPLEEDAEGRDDPHVHVPGIISTDVKRRIFKEQFGARCRPR